MDYIRELNAFYDNDMNNHLGQKAGYLYLALLNIANRLFWRENFMVSDTTLKARAGFKDRRTFSRALEELVQANLIECNDTDQGTVYTIRGLSCQGNRQSSDVRRQGENSGGANNAAKNTTLNAAGDAISDRNSAIVAAFDAGSSSDFEAKVANDARPEKIAGKSDAFFAGNVVNFKRNIATSDAFHAGVSTVFPSNNGNDATFFAADDGDKPSSDTGFSCAQTKPTEKEKEKEKETKQTAAVALDEGTVNNKELIAELVAAYREIPGIEKTKGDYPFMGALYNEYGYDRVLYGIHELSMAAATTSIQKPLIYLRAILLRTGPGPDSFHRADRDLREEDPVEKYKRDAYRG